MAWGASSVQDAAAGVLFGEEMKKNYEGMKCGRLTVLRTYRDGKHLRAECLCECGKICTPIATNVRPNKQVSCGCYRHEVLKAGVHPKTHGQSNRKKPTSEYWAWGAMKRRCNVASDKMYPHYGGRGIYVCDRWLRFENFFSDMGKKPSRSHSLERINNDGPYSRENCRWATKKEQASNTRGNVILNVMGKQMLLRDVAVLFGLDQGVISKRMKSGLSVMEAVAHKAHKQITRGFRVDDR